MQKELVLEVVVRLALIESLELTTEREQGSSKLRITLHRLTIVISSIVVGNIESLLTCVSLVSAVIDRVSTSKLISQPRNDIPRKIKSCIDTGTLALRITVLYLIEDIVTKVHSKCTIGISTEITIEQQLTILIISRDGTAGRCRISDGTDTRTISISLIDSSNDGRIQADIMTKLCSNSYTTTHLVGIISDLNTMIISVRHRGIINQLVIST